MCAKKILCRLLLWFEAIFARLTFFMFQFASVSEDTALKAARGDWPQRCAIELRAEIELDLENMI